MNIDNLTGLVILILWVAGVVIAKGFWSVLFAIIFAPYALYIVIEHTMIHYSII